MDIQCTKMEKGFDNGVKHTPSSIDQLVENKLVLANQKIKRRFCDTFSCLLQRWVEQFVEQFKQPPATDSLKGTTELRRTTDAPSIM